MDENQIRRIMFTHPLLKQDFEDVLSIDEARLPSKKPSSFIFNLDPSDQPGSHWVAVYYSEACHYYFFDSFASPPPQQMTNLYAGIRPWRIPVQSIFSDTCGEYSIVFLLLCVRGYSLSEIENQLTYYNDRDVMHIVKFLTVKKN